MQSVGSRTTLVMILAFLFMLPSSLSISTFSSPTTVNTLQDYWPTNGWQFSTPHDEGMNLTKLQQMIYEIDIENYLIDSVLVVRNRQIVLEEYLGARMDENQTHLMYSVTKSFTSACVGIAIAQGYIESTSETLLSFFPNHTIENLNDWKEQITIQDLLEMRSGMDWDETSAPFNSPDNGIYHINQGDGIQYCLDLPMVAEPGSVWHYNTGASHLLSGIVQAATGIQTREYAREHLFGPLGFDTNYWSSDRQGVTKGGFDLRVTTRDAAKFGLLYLNNGTWDGEEIIPEQWVTDSTSTITTLNPDRGYGMQWWTNPLLDYYFAAGLYGQYIFVIPRYDLIVVFTSSISDFHPHFDFIANNIIAAADDEADNTPFVPPEEPEQTTTQTTTHTITSSTEPEIFPVELLIAITPPVVAVVILGVLLIRRSKSSG